MSSVRSGVDRMIPQAPARGAGADAGRAAVGFSAKRFLTALVAAVQCGVLLIAGANYFLDPLHFSASGMRQVAAVLLSGRNYAVSTRTWIFAGCGARRSRR